MPEQKTQPKPPKPKKIRWLVGGNIGDSRYEEGDVIPAQLMGAATRSAWITQGLIEEVD